jgi:hypothetical protein
MDTWQSVWYIESLDAEYGPCVGYSSNNYSTRTIGPQLLLTVLKTRAQHSNRQHLDE